MAVKPKKATPKVKGLPQGPNPWDVAPILPKGDAELTPIWTAVGRALSAWEKADSVVAWIYGALVSSREDGAAVAAYGTIANSSTRGAMVIVAAEATLKGHPQVFATLTAYINKFSALGARRNDIAHGIAAQFVDDVDDESGKQVRIDHGCFLVPAEYATRKRSPEPWAFPTPMTYRYRYAYTAAQIGAYADHFSALHSEAANAWLMVLGAMRGERGT